MFKPLISDSKRKLNKLLIGTILLIISVLLAVPSGHAFDGPGLYKDGEKVIGFNLAPSDEADIALNATKTMAEEVDRKRRILPENMADADSFSEQKNYIKTLLECKELVKTIKEKLEQDKSIDEESDLLVKKGKDLVQANLEIIRKFNEIERECQERGYSQTILDRHAQMVREHKNGIRELLRLLKNLDDQSDEERLSEKIEKLYKFFSDKKFKEDPPLVNAQALPVNIMRMEAPVVQALEQEAPVDIRRLDPTFEKEGLPAEVKSEKTPVIQKDIRIKGPEDIDILAAPPTQDDLDPTIDVQFTQDITDLANSLDNSPLKIYGYVKNNFEFEPYLGSRKGSQETLNHRSGNDYDLSSLLIAMLRVSNIPARYATGIVEMTPDRAKNWLGVEDAATAGSILTTAGMEGVNIMDGPEVVAIRCRRVWVEAYVPYTNYRGINNNDTGKMWVPMDAAFKQYDYQSGIDIPDEMGFDAKSFVDSYSSTFHTESPVELFKQQITDYLSINYPDLTYEDILRTRSLRSEVLGIIPGSLPYKLLSRDGEYSEIASDKRYQIRFYIHGSGSTLDYTANLPEIAGKQVTISYIGATADDQQIIDNAGGLYGVTQPWLVHLKSVLKIDGCDVATGSGEVTMGVQQDSDMYFAPPVGANNVVPAIYNTIIAGTYQGIGIDTWNVVTNFFAPMSTSCEESYTGYLLHDTAMKYLGRVDASNNEVGKTMQIVIMNDVAEAIVEHVVDVTYDIWGSPLTFEWSGLIVDADRSITGSFSVTGDDESCEFMRLTGADGSILENRIFEDGFNEPAVSTIKILELSSDMSIPIYEFDGTPCSTIYSSLNQPSHVEDAICSAVEGGHVVTIPRDPITYYDWTGTGYIDMKANCAAGYIISGGRSGGATVKTWDIPIAGMECIKAEDISVSSSASPSVPKDIYCGGDTNYLVFTVKITAFAKDGDGNCSVMSGYPTNKTFSTAGGSGLPMTIKYIADNFGGGVYTFYAGSPGSCGGCASASKEFTIVKVALRTLEFKSDHNLMCNGTSVLSVGTRFPGVEWDSAGSSTVNAPISHSAGDSTHVSIEVTLQGEGIPSNSAYTITGTSSEDALEFTDSGSISSGSSALPINSSNPLGKEIRKIMDSISWSIEIAGCTFDLGITGPHKIYMTVDTPITSAPGSASVPNESRMELSVARVNAAISAAGSAVDAYTCFPRIVWNLMRSAGSYNLGTTLSDVQAWNLPSTPADCISIARFVRNVSMVIGIPGGFCSEYYAAYYATATDPERPTKALANVALNSPYIHPEDKGVPQTGGLDAAWTIALTDKNCRKYGAPSTPPGTVGCGPNGFNAFEAAVIYTDPMSKKWYLPAGVTGDPRYDEPDSVVQIFQTLAWVDDGDHDGNPSTPDVLIVKEVDYTYSRPIDVDLCP